MIVLDFGNCCFNGSREEYIMIVVAPKADFASKDAFLDGAIRFLNADENSDFFDDYEELYQERSYEPVNIDIDADFKNMNQRVGFLHEPVLQAFSVGKDEWNDWSAILETKSEYILYRWATSA